MDRGTPAPLCSPGQLDNAEREGGIKGEREGGGGGIEGREGLRGGKKREGMTTMMEDEAVDNRIIM